MTNQYDPNIREIEFYGKKEFTVRYLNTVPIKVISIDPPEGVDETEVAVLLEENHYE